MCICLRNAMRDRGIDSSENGRDHVTVRVTSHAVAPGWSETASVISVSRSSWWERRSVTRSASPRNRYSWLGIASRSPMCSVRAREVR